MIYLQNLVSSLWLKINFQAASLFSLNSITLLIERIGILVSTPHCLSRVRTTCMYIYTSALQAMRAKLRQYFIQIYFENIFLVSKKTEYVHLSNSLILFDTKWITLLELMIVFVELCILRGTDYIKVTRND